MEEDTFRRSGMHDELSEAEGVDYAPSEDLEEEQDSTAQRMASKIRDQAVRLNQLEAENQILRQRKADPPPAPIEQRTPTRETSSPRQKTKINELQTEMDHLYKSMQAEILNGEEQRAYIEILRTALEAKMEDLGFVHKDVDAYSQIARVKEESDAVKHEAAQLQAVVSDQEFQIKKAQDRMATIAQEHEEAITQHQQMEADLNESIKALQIAQKELDKLTNEKQELLAAIEDSDANVQAFQDELSELNGQLTNAAQEKQEADVKIETTEATVAKLREEVAKLSEENHEKDSEIEAEKQTLYELHSSLTLNEHQLVDTQATLDRERDLWSRQKEHFEQEIATIRGVNENLEKSLDETNKNLQSEKSNHAQAQVKLQDLNNQIESMTHRHERVQANLNAVTETLRETQSEKDKIRANRDKTANELQTLQNLSERLQGKLTDSEEKGLMLSTQIQTMTEKLIRKKTKLRDTTTFKETIENELKDEVQEKARLHELFTKTQDDLANENAKLAALESKLRLMTTENDELAAKNSALEGLNSEKNQSIDALTRDNTDLQQKFNATRHELEDAILELDETKQESDNIQAKLKLQETDLFSTHNDIAQLETKLASIHYNETLLDEENRKLRQHLEECQKDLAQSTEQGSNLERELRNRDMEIASNRQYMDELKTQLNSSEMNLRYANEDLMREKQNVDMERGEKLQAQGACDMLRKDAKKISHILNMFSSNTMVMLQNSTTQAGIVSSGVKELLPRLANSQFDTGDLSTLVDWIGASCDELEALIRRASEFKQENENSTKVIQDLNETRYRENEERQRSHNQAIEASNNEQQTLRREISLLRAKEQELQRDNEMLMGKIQQFNDAQSDDLQLKLIEEREKKNLESLIGRLQMLLPSALQRSSAEILQLRKDQSSAEREKIKIENHIAILEGDFNSTVNRRELDTCRDKLSSVKRDLQMYTRQIVSLEDELTKIDANERRNASIASDYALQSKEDQIKNQSMELDKTRYEKQEVESAYQSLLTEKYTLEAQLQQASSLSKSPLRRRPPSIPRRFVSSGSKSSLGQSIEARLSQNRFAEDLMRSSDRRVSPRMSDLPKQEDI